jgi:hypothetical protein
MSLFYDRIESSGKTVIVYKYWPLFYYGLGGTIISSFILGKWCMLVGLLFAMFVVVLLLDLWKPTREVKKAMKNGQVKISGSKFSFKNPLTIEISED